MTMKHYTKLQISTTKYTVQPCCLVTAIINMIFWFCTELLSSVNKTLSVWHFNFGISQQQLLICMYVLCLMTYVLLCMNVFTIFGGCFHFLTIICISRVCVRECLIYGNCITICFHMVNCLCKLWLCLNKKVRLKLLFDFFLLS